LTVAPGPNKNGPICLEKIGLPLSKALRIQDYPRHFH
jgi:hypothetical protein